MHKIDGFTVDVLHHLAEFAQFNDIPYHVALPVSTSDWWHQGGDYELGML